MVLRQAYLIAYNLAKPHENPLDHVTDSDHDGFRELTWLNKIIDDFSTYEISSIYGISLKEFLDQTYSTCNMMLDKGRKRFEAKLKAYNDAERERLEREAQAKRAAAQAMSGQKTFDQIRV